MRKKEREVTDLDEIIEIMQGCDVCRLGLNDEDVLFNKAAMGRTAVFALDVEEITGKRKEAKVF